MNTQLKGAIQLMVATTIVLALVVISRGGSGFLLSTFIIGGQLSMALAFWIASWEERKKSLRPWRVGIISGFLAMVPGTAKALIAWMVAIGVGVGIAAWIAMAIASRLISFKLNELGKPIIIEEVINADTNEVMVAARGYPSKSPSKHDYQQPGIMAGADDQQAWVRISVPAFTTLEFSTNLLHWGPIHITGQDAEDTFWTTEGRAGYFRLKAERLPNGADDWMK